MKKLGLLATVAVLSLAGATASRAESVIVQESAIAPAATVAPAQQIVTERTIEPGLFGDQFVRERTIVTQPMVTERAVVAPAPTVVAPTVVAPTPRVVVRQEPRYRVIDSQPAYRPGVAATVVNDPYYQTTYWNDYGYQPAYRSTYSACGTDFDGIRRCY